MGYLLLAIISSVFVSLIMRVSEKHVQNQMAMFMANYALCMLFSFLFMPKMYNTVSSITIILGTISGFLYLISFVYLKMNMKHNGIVMSATFMKLGVLIPTLMAIVCFKEKPSFL